MKKTTAWLVALCMLCAVPFGPLAARAGDAAREKVSASFFGTFDTLITVMGYPQDQAAFDRVFAQVQAAFQRYHEVYDAYQPHEGVHGLHYLNRHGAEGPVAVEPELLALLLFCREYQPITLGTVNVALGAVLQIWHDYREAGEADPANAQIPPMEALGAALAHTSFDDIVIDEAAGTVYFADPKLQLDLGAVAKGYAAEQVAQWLLASEMPSFLISAGGNVRVGLPPMDGRQRWGVSIQDPGASIFGNPNEGTVDTLFLAEASVVTSGDYQRFYVVDGKRYHHLIAPDTLMPGDLYRSVTVVCEDSGLADLLSTAFFLLPYDQGRALADSMEGVEVFWILNDGEDTIAMTDGMAKMSRANGASSRD